MLDTQKIIEESARALYAAHHWRDVITEKNLDRLSQSEYELRACARWDDGTAGETNYSKYLRMSEIAFPIFRDAIFTAQTPFSPLVVAELQELAKAA